MKKLTKWMAVMLIPILVLSGCTKRSYDTINLHLEYLRICLYTALTALVTSIQSYPMERLLLMRTTARLSRQF